MPGDRNAVFIAIAREVKGALILQKKRSRDSLKRIRYAAGYYNIKRCKQLRFTLEVIMELTITFSGGKFIVAYLASKVASLL